MSSIEQPEGEVHDHAPRHGGVVGMSGSRHVEATATSDGVVRFYLTDFHRAPLPLGGVKATAIVGAGDDRRTVPIVVEDGALVARTTPLAGPTVDARLEATLPGEREKILIDFTLPVTAP